MEGTFLNTIRKMHSHNYNKWEKLEAFTLSSGTRQKHSLQQYIYQNWNGTRQECPYTPLLFHIVVEVLVGVICQGG